MQMNNIALVLAAVITMSPLTLVMANDVQAVAVEARVKSTPANQPEQSVQKTFTNLINAIEQNNYTQFISQGSPDFKKGLTKQIFTHVSEQLAPRLKKGYTSVFLTKLNQQGYQVYLWKLSFKDGSDDILARLSLKDAKIAGFWLN
ncbi:hypothetical protein [Nostoc sp. FACHB-280]|uniref:hypothetical protein n=1 Tax=Nostoc sp. FACHB-280 TaxID=2692839 RepID=UPI001F54896A|nr:hypothetical protein [Nostoc sp. FACHB-280]